MKIFVYSYRDFDEAAFFTKFAKESGVELGICRDDPDMDNAALAKGYPYISILTTKIDAELVQRFYDLGVRMISTRTVGYDHIDLAKARELGMHVGNATYSPHCVADYTVMLMLMCIRKMKRIMQRAELNDFSLPGIQGRELRNFTVGVIGTGKIGETVIKNLSGFGCEICAHDLYEKESVRAYAKYAPLEKIYEKCDLISLHMPLTKDNYHMIGEEAIRRMREGTVLVNTARGGLVDTRALINGIKSGKIAAAGLDVIENEFGMYYFDRKSDILDKEELAILRSFPNVIVTPHMAFYTDESVSDMVKHSIQSCCLEEEGKENPWKIF